MTREEAAKLAEPGVYRLTLADGTTRRESLAYVGGSDPSERWYLLLSPGMSLEPTYRWGRVVRAAPLREVPEQAPDLEGTLGEIRHQLRSGHLPDETADLAGWLLDQLDHAHGMLADYMADHDEIRQAGAAEERGRAISHIRGVEAGPLRGESPELRRGLLTAANFIRDLPPLPPAPPPSVSRAEAERQRARAERLLAALRGVRRHLPHDLLMTPAEAEVVDQIARGAIEEAEAVLELELPFPPPRPSTTTTAASAGGS